MNARVLLACTRKEALLLWRDPQTLVLLFVMPAVFILLMSLALQDQFAQPDTAVVTVRVADDDGGPAAARLLAELRGQGSFDVVPVAAVAHLRREVADAGDGFGLHIERGFDAAIAGGDARPGQSLQVLIGARVDPAREALLLAALRQSLGKVRLHALGERLGPLVDFDPDTLGDGVRVDHLYAGGRSGQAPSSVQQNVPAWLVFGMFFIVIPLSNTLIRERQSGMERRLRTTPAGAGTLLAGKLLPYFGVNQLQAVAMLLVGVYLVPALGGQALALAGVPIATLVLMTVSVSLAALGYALLVAAISRTPEQASMLGGGGNIILAAIGGIMVPEFVMPPALQAVTRVSPMGWGLHGFLPAFLEHAGPAAVWGQALALTLFGAAGIALAVLWQLRRQE